MNSNTTLLLCLCLFGGCLSIAGAAEIGAVMPDTMPDSGFPAGEVVSIPIQITGAQNIGYFKATLAEATGGQAVIRDSSFGNTAINAAADRIIWYGNYTGDINGSSAVYNASGYSNPGSATLFYLDVTPDGTAPEAVVKLTFNEIWKTTLADAIPLYLSGDSLILSIPAEMTGPAQVTVTYTGGTVPEATVPESETVALGDDFQVSPYRAHAGGHIFSGWLTGETIVSPGDILTAEADIELTAQWHSLPDGFVPTFSDLLILSNYIVNGGSVSGDYDLNGDKTIDVLDLVLMACYVADYT